MQVGLRLRMLFLIPEKGVTKVGFATSFSFHMPWRYSFWKCERLSVRSYPFFRKRTMFSKLLSGISVYKLQQ